MERISSITQKLTTALRTKFPGSTSEEITLRAYRHENSIRERVQPFTNLYVDVSKGSRNVAYLVNDWLVLGYQLSLIDYTDFNNFEDLVFAGTLLGMLDTMIDDIVDDQHAWSPLLAKKLLSLFDDSIQEQEKEELKPDEEVYYQYSKKIWETIINTLKTFPQYTEMKPIFDESIEKLKEMFSYCIDVREKTVQPTYKKSSELLPHNLTLWIYTVIALMNSTYTYTQERIDTIREVALCGQRIQHYFNLFATYKREADEGDITNELVCLALERGDITLEDIAEKRKERVLPALETSVMNERPKLEKDLRMFNTLCRNHPIPLDNFRIGVQAIGILYELSASRV